MMEIEKPVLTTEADTGRLIGSLSQGGLTIVENSSHFGVEFTLYFLIKFAEKHGIPLIVEDIFDTLPVYTTHLELMKVPVNTNKVEVIKVGGGIDVGRVIGRIRFEEDPAVYQRKLEELLKNVSYEHYIHLVLGIERLMMFQKRVYNNYTLINTIRRKLGNSRSRNVYVIETPVLKGMEFNPLPLLEDAATSVIQLSDEDDLIKIRFKKSIFTLLTNKNHVLVSPKEVLQWWG